MCAENLYLASPLYGNFQERVVQAAESALKRHGSVGPLDLFQAMQLLQSVHFEGWRNGNEYYRVRDPWLQAGPERFQKAIRYFQEWAAVRGLRTIEAAYTRRGPGGIEPLQVTENGDPEREKFYRTHYAPADLGEKKTARLAAKLNRPPELVVFQKVSDKGYCSECGAELPEGEFLLIEQDQPLCLACADLDELLFLPAGDTALTRRSPGWRKTANLWPRWPGRFRSATPVVQPMKPAALPSTPAAAAAVV
jgi:hypothetical protein